MPTHLHLWPNPIKPMQPRSRVPRRPSPRPKLAPAPQQAWPRPLRPLPRPAVCALPPPPAPRQPGLQTREVLDRIENYGWATGCLGLVWGPVAAALDQAFGGRMHDVQARVGWAVLWSAAGIVGAHMLRGVHRLRQPLAYLTPSDYCYYKCIEATHRDGLDDALMYLGHAIGAWGAVEDLQDILSSRTRATLAQHAAQRGVWRLVRHLTASGFDRAAALPILRLAHMAAGTSEATHFFRVLVWQILDSGVGTMPLEHGLELVPWLENIADDLGVADLYQARARQEITDRGVLLGIHFATLDTWLLDYPSLWALLRSRHVTGNDAHMRRAITAIKYLKDNHPPTVSHGRGVAPEMVAQSILRWPSDSYTQEMFLDGWRRAQHAASAAIPAWQRGDLSRAQARSAIDAAHAAHEVLVLHANFAHSHGLAQVVRDYQEAIPKLLLQLRSTIALLRPRLAPSESAAHALAATLSDIDPLGPATQVEKLSKQIGHWSKGHTSDARHGEVAALLRQTTAELLALLRLQSTLRRDVVFEPCPGRGPDSFWLAAMRHRHAAPVFNRHVAPGQLDGLFGLAVLGHMGESSHACHAPADIAKKIHTSLNLAADERTAFEALLQTFRQPMLFWAFMTFMRRHDADHAYESRQALASVLRGTYEIERREAPQMRFFADRPDLLDAWDAGAMEEASESFVGLTLADTATFADFASSGDEITGSCHSLFNPPQGHNLLGRMRDGSRRMLAIKAADGTLLARAMWRLTNDPQGNPVALLSRVYVARAYETQKPGMTDALVAFAVRRSLDLGIAAAASKTCIAPGPDETNKPCPPLSCLRGYLGDYWDEKTLPVADAHYLSTRPEAKDRL